MTATQPTTNTLAIDTETRQISGYATWAASETADTIAVEVPIPDGQLPPHIAGSVTVMTTCHDGGKINGVSLIVHDGETYCDRVIEHECDGIDAHECQPPLIGSDVAMFRTNNLWRFEANRPANCELVLTPNFGV